MNTKVIALAACLLQLPAYAVNRCTIDGKTVYQEQPCPGTLGTVGDELKAKEAGRKATTTPAQPVAAAQTDALDRLTTYTTILGRGIACGAPGTDDAARQLGIWMNAAGLNDYSMTAAAGIRMAAEQQRAGKSPDTCAQVRKIFPSITWP